MARQDEVVAVYHAQAVFSEQKLQARVSALEDSIRKHRDYRGDDRCWLDDEELYAALPEGYTPPEREVAVELSLCEMFIKCRRNPKTQYVSPQREIERLSQKVCELQQLIQNLQNQGDSRGS